MGTGPIVIEPALDPVDYIFEHYCIVLKGIGLSIVIRWPVQIVHFGKGIGKLSHEFIDTFTVGVMDRPHEVSQCIIRRSQLRHELVELGVPMLLWYFS